ncbi:FadR/GntR family transcriptional regulator [Pseudonocardia xinjiangensis]|uniref:FadR family transcriptional regulator n=1 Tax=Pseudonocardia xinjiangensis TaxID=75289 RepID=A0ABX1RH17_9PSEU|nr:FCD domain-containing protein [Pseudonocardia xinjiangensis]NMH79681.1 FadR family transcriptional regulator [Pseudonocardia xinjiangensis]
MLGPAVAAGPAGRPPRLPEVVANRIQARLFADRLVPGDQLPTEAQLAQTYDVSRTVVREAARILEQRGLVSIRPGRGMMVALLDGRPIAEHFSLLLRSGPAVFEQLMEARFLLEVELAALAAVRRSERDLEEMRAALSVARDHRDDFDVCLAQDLAFHRVTARASGNTLLALFMDPVNACLRESYREPMAYLAQQGHTLDEHQAIYDAIAAQDADAARRACREHLQRITRESGTLLAESVGSAPPAPPADGQLTAG